MLTEMGLGVRICGLLLKRGFSSGSFREEVLLVDERLTTHLSGVGLELNDF